ncbi:MAG: SAM-dependent methyltransferase [Deltaproteobacteria bacterium]|nr:SAM-dependent methyltransferase [Deltaproteobacteria bacterium]
MKPITSSFRDPHGFLATHEGKLYRVVTRLGKPDYDLFAASPLKANLESTGRLVRHEIIDRAPFEGDFYKILTPEPIPFISYPYEWSFSQLKDAALLTLTIQKEALGHNLSLKDASAFNVQFVGSRPIFIDLLSFEKREDTPWVAYRQFCQHFLGPLLLMSHHSPDFNRHLKNYLDGFPLSFVAPLLPLKAKVRPGVFMHILLHAASQKKHERGGGAVNGIKPGSFGLTRLLALVDHLLRVVEGIRLPKGKSEWSEYVPGYSKDGMELKKKFVSEVLDATKTSSVWDLGGNTGDFSKLVADRGIYTVSLDLDPLCVEKNYLSVRGNGKPILPLLMDLANPTPAIGWGHEERMSLLERGRPGLILALALIHHLRITANIPIARIAEFFSKCADRAIVEFVPKEDPMATILLSGRKDIFHDYTKGEFEKTFGLYFPHVIVAAIPGSKRILYSFSKA